MKVTLKTPGLDLEIDNVKNLDEVYTFLEKMKELELRVVDHEIQSTIALGKQGKRKKPPVPQPRAL